MYFVRKMPREAVGVTFALASSLGFHDVMLLPVEATIISQFIDIPGEHPSEREEPVLGGELLVHFGKLFAEMIFAG